MLEHKWTWEERCGHPVLREMRKIEGVGLWAERDDKEIGIWITEDKRVFNTREECVVAHLEEKIHEARA